MASQLKFALDTLPIPGFEVNEMGFRYVVIAAREHITREGAASMKITWRGRCATCGGSFDFSTGPKVYNMRRRCRQHNEGWARAVPWVEPSSSERSEAKAFADAFCDHLESAHKSGTPERSAANRFMNAMWDFFNERYGAEEDQATIAADMLS